MPSHKNNPSVDSSLRLDAILTRLHERGGRVTPQRRALIAEFLRREDHPSAETLHKAVLPDYPSMALSTVYDTLRLLVELGEAAEVLLGGSEARFDPIVSDHCHLICTRCGRVTDAAVGELPTPTVPPELLSEHGFTAERAVLDVFGLCAACQSDARRRSPQP